MYVLFLFGAALLSADIDIEGHSPNFVGNLILS